MKKLLPLKPSLYILRRLLIPRMHDALFHISHMRRDYETAPAACAPGRRPPGAVGREGLDVEDVQRRAPDPTLLQRLVQGAIIDQRSPRRVDQQRRVLHVRQLPRAHDAPRPLAQHVVQAHHVGGGEQLVLADGRERRRACACAAESRKPHLFRLPVGALLRQVLAPADHAHAPREAPDARHGGAEPAQPHDAQRRARQAGRQPGLPLGARALHGRVVGGDVPRQGQDQRPRVLGRRVAAALLDVQLRPRPGGGGGSQQQPTAAAAAAVGAAPARRRGHADPELRGRGQVEGLELRAGGQEQLQVRERPEQRPGERRALPHRGDDGEGLQPLDQGAPAGLGGRGVVVRGQRIAECRDG